MSEYKTTLHFSRGSMPWTPLKAHACGDHGYGYVGLKNRFFLVDRAKISETGVLKI